MHMTSGLCDEVLAENIWTVLSSPLRMSMQLTTSLTVTVEWVRHTSSSVAPGVHMQIRLSTAAATCIEAYNKVDAY
jgi:hypothetical protein